MLLTSATPLWTPGKAAPFLHNMELTDFVLFLARIRWILGFDPADMVGLKAYEYFHPLDLQATSSCHTNRENPSMHSLPKWTYVCEVLSRVAKTPSVESLLRCKQPFTVLHSILRVKSPIEGVSLSPTRSSLSFPFSISSCKQSRMMSSCGPFPHCTHDCVPLHYKCFAVTTQTGV